MAKVEAVLRIRDILVRIRIRGLEHCTNGSGYDSGSCYFRQWPSRQQQKFFFFLKWGTINRGGETATNFFSFFLSFLNFTFWRYIYIVFKIKSHKKVTKQYGMNQGFSRYFDWWSGCGSGSVSLTNGSGSGRPKTYGFYGSGSTTLG